MAVKRKTKRKATPAQLRARALFAKRARAGTLRKVKRNPAKKKRIKRAPLRVKKAAKRLKAAKGKKKIATSSQRATRTTIKNPKRKTNSKFVIMGTKPSKNGYSYYYLKKNGRYDSDIRKAQRWNTRVACNLKMRSAAEKMPFALSSIRCVKL